MSGNKERVNLGTVSTICDDFFAILQLLIVSNSFRNVFYKIVDRCWLFLPFFSRKRRSTTETSILKREDEFSTKLRDQKVKRLATCENYK